MPFFISGSEVDSDVSEDTRSVAEIKELLKNVAPEGFSALEATLSADPRKGVQQALNACRRRIEREEQERERLKQLYAFEEDLAQGKLVVGLDEVGRGPLAGPLSVGAVVLNPQAAPIVGLNDSKQIPEAKRPSLADAIKRSARAYAVVHIPPQDIDEYGIVSCLKRAFRTAIDKIEEKGVVPEVVLLDGNPLGIDPREINVVKGDARCASIAAASLVAKVERDELMVEYDALYPGYDLASSKGYGSAQHRQAIQEKGLSPIHRVSYCGNFFQERLF